MRLLGALAGAKKAVSGQQLAALGAGRIGTVALSPDSLLVTRLELQHLPCRIAGLLAIAGIVHATHLVDQVLTGCDRVDWRERLCTRSARRETLHGFLSAGHEEGAILVGLLTLAAAVGHDVRCCVAATLLLLHGEELPGGFAGGPCGAFIVCPADTPRQPFTGGVADDRCTDPCAGFRRFGLGPARFQYFCRWNCDAGADCDRRTILQLMDAVPKLGLDPVLHDGGAVGARVYSDFTTSLEPAQGRW